MSFTKDTFCSYCGCLLSQKDYPKKCLGCDVEIYNNPAPVVAPLIFVMDGDKIGVLVIKRNIEPKKGEWALPGGYLEKGESWQEGAARELLEETGLELSPDGFEAIDIVTATNGNLIIFADYMSLEKEDLSFKENEEVSEIKVIFKPESLAFPSHTEKVAEAFDQLGEVPLKLNKLLN